MGFPFYHPLHFLPHSSADPVTNQLWLARSCSLASSISPPNFSYLPGCCWTISMQLYTNSQYMSHMISSRWPQPQSLVACFGWRARWRWITWVDKVICVSLLTFVPCCALRLHNTRTTRKGGRERGFVRFSYSSLIDWNTSCLGYRFFSWS